MISYQESNLADGKKSAIREALLRPGIVELLEVAKNEVAIHQVNALKHFTASITYNGNKPVDQAQSDLQQAAKIQCFIDVLTKYMDLDYKFKLVQLKA